MAFHEADLTRAMEHMRPYVSVPVSHSPEAASPDIYGIPDSVINPPRKPAQRSPSNPEKRTDPFQFGSRYLEEGDDVFEYNAWDHVEVDDAFKAFAEEQYQRQKESPVSDFDKSRFNGTPEKWWNKFYSNNSTNFFKNRKWLFQEFPSLAAATAADSPPVTILEVGAGAGNTAFPVLENNSNPNLKIHACDYSRTAVELIRSNPAYESAQIQADVWDVAAASPSPSSSSTASYPEEDASHLPPGLKPGSVDIVILIFIFSALAPAQWTQALHNIHTLLKPGGEILFRDYGRGDLAQVRFKKGRWLDDNFYARGDGTRVYFFEKEELEQIFGHAHIASSPCSQAKDSEQVKGDSKEVAEGAAAAAATGPSAEQRPRFEIINLGVDRRMLVNRRRKLKMYRCWMQGRFRKLLTSSSSSLPPSSSPLPLPPLTTPSHEALPKPTEA